MRPAIEVLDAFEHIRRAQRAGVYAPHKPLLILMALARVQRGELSSYARIADRVWQTAKSIAVTAKLEGQRNQA